MNVSYIRSTIWPPLYGKLKNPFSFWILKILKAKRPGYLNSKCRFERLKLLGMVWQCSRIFESRFSSRYDSSQNLLSTKHVVRSLYEYRFQRWRPLRVSLGTSWLFYLNFCYSKNFLLRSSSLWEAHFEYLKHFGRHLQSDANNPLLLQPISVWKKVF